MKITATERKYCLNLLEAQKACSYEGISGQMLIEVAVALQWIKNVIVEHDEQLKNEATKQALKKGKVKSGAKSGSGSKRRSK